MTLGGRSTSGRRDVDRSATVRSWLAVAGVCVLVSGALALLGSPSPVLFGALAAGMGQALLGASPVALPLPGFRLGQALIGVTVGALVEVSTLARLATDWPSVVLVTVGTIAVSLLAGRLMALLSDVSTTTGLFALIAGGASGVVAVARDLGADDRVVTVVQYLRVVVVVLVMPLLATVVFHPPTGRGQLASTATRWPADLAYVALAVAGGLLVARVVRAPAAALLGPMVVAVALGASGLLGAVTVPAPVQALGYALVGVAVGLRFTRASLRSIARLLPLTLALIAFLIAACAGLGLLLAAATGVDPLTAYLATTPGGLFAVLALAADSGSDPTYVLAVQVIRVFAMLLVAPLLARHLGGRGGPA